MALASPMAKKEPKRAVPRRLPKSLPPKRETHDFQHHRPEIGDIKRAVAGRWRQ